MTKEEIIDNYINKLSKSKFRSNFHLNKKMIEYCKNKGYKKIQNDAFEIIEKRLKVLLDTDGKQTPMRQVHPVFIAEHATATCCRGCLEKWYNIPKNKELNTNEVNFIVSLIMRWIVKEIENK